MPPDAPAAFPPAACPAGAPRAEARRPGAAAEIRAAPEPWPSKPKGRPPNPDRKVQVCARVEPATLSWLRTFDPLGEGSPSRALDELRRRVRHEAPERSLLPTEAAASIVDEIGAPRAQEPQAVQRVRFLAEIDAALRRRGQSPSRAYVKATAEALHGLLEQRAARGRRL